MALHCRFKVTMPRKRGKVTFTWRVVDAPKEFVKKIEPLTVDLMFSLGDVKYIRPEFGDGQPAISAPLNQPISVRLLRADGADSPIGFEELEPISVEVYRSQKSPQPMYTLPLAGSRLAQDDASLQYVVGEFTLARVGARSRHGDLTTDRLRRSERGGDQELRDGMDRLHDAGSNDPARLPVRFAFAL